MKGQNIPTPGIPESFKVLIKELQSLALDVKVLDENNEEIDLRQDLDDDVGFNPQDDNYEGPGPTVADESDGAEEDEETESDDDALFDDSDGYTQDDADKADADDELFEKNNFDAADDKV